MLLQESVSGQGASLTNLAAAGETAPVGAASIQPSQYSDNTQVCQQLHTAVHLLLCDLAMHAAL